ncbi:hypothetical protein G6F40_015755 [Rhizopus arrhizus]|nr:hypothetical protein G6F40_015755 [Rhizopus arrhizus]
MAEYRSDGHVTAVPACWLEQCRPVMPIPCRKQRVIAHTHDHAGFIELGQCCLRAVALARRHCLDMPALLRVECLLELRETGPHQCIEQVMPVVGADRRPATRHPVQPGVCRAIPAAHQAQRWAAMQCRPADHGSHAARQTADA